MQVISIVVPCYNEQESLPLFFKRVDQILTDFDRHREQYRWEYWFVNDGSTDDSLKQMQILHAAQPDKVHYINFSRNFGKEAALLAGLKAARGDEVAVMDVDLQDPPELLPTMIAALAETDYDVIGTQRSDRQGEPWLRSKLSSAFYHVINRISQVQIVPGARDYRLMRRSVVDAVIAMPEYNRFSKGIFSWVGFKTKYLTFQHQDRVAGHTHWSMKQLLDYSLEGIMDYSEVPLSVASWLGGTAFVVSIIGMIWIVIRALLFGNPTAGWPSLVAIILMLGGLQLLCLGILGKYVGRIYLETKHRPQYLIQDKR
ncbi:MULTISPECIES: glycosyltransferase family 2 protein [Lactobacillaceae]|uniref:glycosyltransferase family 2 protein n=1 Tax=Lactobacillaceae TaxID=33958 RepID=UPI00145686DF|nr:glycosyltransferase family 2 protein [Lactobacillus sp. HBUAS51381]NLR10719.1 glycosyltransferase family 2 protein [Lactobacillus sp. HBUAS51381]